MEACLGTINGTNSKAKLLTLRNNGITQRYYALDKEGNVTHTNVQLAAEAVRRVCNRYVGINDIELIAAGTSSPEMLLPSHGVMIHGEVGGKNAEVVSFTGSCCTGIQALKYGWMSLRMRDKNNAVCVASERLSAWMRNKYFEGEAEILMQLEKKPMLAFEKEFLRWMLSDGASAVLLQSYPAENQLSLCVDWVELCSFANITKTCMYAGAEKNAAGDLDGWTSFAEKEWLERSIFSVKQDTRLLGENIITLGGRFLKEVIERRRIIWNNIDWFLPHLSSMYFKSKIEEELQSLGLPIPEEKWFINLPTVGNVASASMFLMLEELFYSGRLKRGDKILCMVPESARFSFGFCLLTVY
jgi:3-oxoacyl-[acyl-carrier-protein] synthase-3